VLAAWRSRRVKESSNGRRTSVWCAARPVTTPAGTPRAVGGRGPAGHGIGLDAGETFETPTPPRQPARAYLTIIEGCDKSMRLLRRTVYAGRERSRPAQRNGRGARSRPAGTRKCSARQNVNSYRDPSPAGWTLPNCWPAWETPGLRECGLRRLIQRLRKGDRRRDRRQPGSLRPVHLPVQSGSTRCWSDAGSNTREEYLRASSG